MVLMSERAIDPDSDWELWRRFVRMFRTLDRALEDDLKRDAGLSQSEFVVLVTLHDAPERRLRSGRLAELTRWEKSRLSHQVSRLEQRGLITREECDDDLRGTWVTLTADGRRAILRALRPHNASIRERFLVHLSDDEKRALASLSASVLEGLGADDGFPADRPSARPPSRKSA